MSSEHVYLRCCGCCSGAVDGLEEFSIVDFGKILWSEVLYANWVRKQLYCEERDTVAQIS